jgi:hypothetical protein
VGASQKPGIANALDADLKVWGLGFRVEVRVRV